jgi:hypothetical protein
MKRRLWRIVIAGALLVIGGTILFESVTGVGRGWWNGEPFYAGRPASYWANEIERWETQHPDWEMQTYTRREKMEQIFVEQSEKVSSSPSLFDVLDKQPPLLPAKEIKIERDKEELLLSLTKECTCLPRPAQLRKGQHAPQKIDEGVVLRAKAQVSSDRRYVRMTFIEKSSELEGIDNIPLVLDVKGEMVLDAKGAAAVAQIACVKECSLSLLRNMADGGALLLPLQSRPVGVREKGRWLVARIEVRIYIEAEERLIRGQPAK